MDSVRAPFHNMLAARPILSDSLNGPIGRSVHLHVPALDTAKSQYRFASFKIGEDFDDSYSLVQPEYENKKS